MKRFVSLLMFAAAVLALTFGTAFADRPYQDAFVYTENGGGLNTDDGNVQLYIPPGAYPGPLKVRYTPKTLAHFPGGAETYRDLILIGKPFNLEIQVKDGGETVPLDKPATIIVPYNLAEFGGRAESAVHLGGYDGDRDRWWPMPSTVDTARKVVIAEITEGGDFGIIVDNVPPTATPVPPPAEPPVAAVPTPEPTPSIPMSSGVVGRVFYDRDGNGVMDGEDFPIAGADLRISSGGWSASTRSGADGTYAFWVLRESAYTVEVIVGPEWAFTTPNVVGDIRVSGQADSVGTANFGMWYRVE